MDVKEELITPAKAERYLNKNKANRHLRSGVAERYASDMKAGRWTKCPVPIAFYEDGDIADGQHRLFAIVDSGASISFLVVRGLSREDGLNLDTGVGRTLVDNARISGTDDKLSNELLAIASFFVNGRRGGKSLSPSQKLDNVNYDRDSIQWAASHSPKGRGFRNSIICSAVARAKHHGVDEQRLLQFIDVFSSGFSSGMEDSAAVALRNYVITNGTGLYATDPRDLFLKTMNCIDRFLKRKQLSLIKAVKDEVYPLKKRRAAQ